VTITGTAFGATQSTSVVKFNGLAATVVGPWSATSITALVPTGATSGNVIVTVAGVDSNSISFTVTRGIVLDVPQVVPFGAQTSGSRMEITNATTTLDFPPGTGSVGLTIVSPDIFTTPNASDRSWSVTVTPGMPILSSCLTDPTEAVACHDFPVPLNLTPPNCTSCTTSHDTVTIIPRANISGSLRFDIRVDLYSNYDKGGVPNPTFPQMSPCASTQTINPERYTIILTSGPSITGVCVNSYTKPTPVVGCAGADIVVDPSLGASTDGLPHPTMGCAKERPAVDVAMVLDKSGSMLTPLTPSEAAFCSGLSSSNSRFDSLSCAAKRFLDLWDPQPTNPQAPVTTGDSAGMVSFSTAATSPVDAVIAPVNPGNSALKSAINGISVGGATSIGSGLHAADGMFTSTGHRKVVLLMTDGQQNTDPMVEVNPTPGIYCETASNCAGLPTSGGCNYTSTNPCPLTSGASIYTVTLGPSTGLPQAVQQAVSNASLGFYLHTDTDGGLLSPFFLELLQNFLRFNSYETVRMISEKATANGYSAVVPITTTSHDVILSLMWPKELGPLRITVTPPGGAQPIVREDESGFITIMQALPLPPPFDPTNSWQINVQAPRLVAAMSAIPQSIPFDLHIMTEDAGMKADLSVVPGDYKAGDNIRLRAQLRYFGRPVLGVGSHAGDKIVASLVAPGQGVGDMLSDSTASSVSPRPDIASGPEAKLFNAVQAKPLLTTRPPDITLYDDGKKEHGDDVAGDGIYSALVPAPTSGDYNFVLSAESTDPNSIRFSRQQLRAAYIRAVPDSGNTVISSSVQRRDRQGVLSIVMTPRVKPAPGCGTNDPKCGRMGPGWANYFWFVAPGQTPVKAKDNLDGTYTATVSFNGSVPPAVKVHFENVLAVIGDSVTPDKLPQPLNSGNELTTCCTRPSGRAALFLDVGPNLRQLSGNPYLGFSTNAGLEFMAASHLALDGIFGYHRFSHKFAPDPDIYQFSFNARIYPWNGALRPFINGGFGGYKFGGAQTHIGANVGGGILFPLSRHVGAEAAYNHHVISDGNSTQFDTLEVGLRYQF